MTTRHRGVSQLFFFFSSRRRHTRFDCDWSSDVCSSDLHAAPGRHRRDRDLVQPAPEPRLAQVRQVHARARQDQPEIGRASCREGGKIWVVAESLKKKKNKNVSKG